MKKFLIVLIFFYFLFFLFPIKSKAGNFFITSYIFNDSEANAIASKYDIVITSLGKASVVLTMKSINPSMKAFYYKDSLTYGAAYYVLDAMTGKKIVQYTWDWYLHDISNPKYRSALAKAIAQDLNTYPQFDGVFLDDVWGSIDTSEFHQEGTSKDPNLPAYLLTNWKTYMFELIKAVKAAIGPKLLILNCRWTAINFVTEADGLMYESFVHPNWLGPTVFWDVNTWGNHLTSLKNAVANSKYYLAQSGVSDGATEEQIKKLVRYSFSSFLLALPANNSYAKHYFCPSIYYKNYYWYSDWGIKLGNPIEDYFEVPGKNLYRRNFEKGIVIVNPTDRSGKVKLEKAYCNLNGQPIAEIDFSDHEGIILLNCSKDGTPPLN